MEEWKMPYADVILPLPVKRTFTYHVPKDLAGIIAIGKRVRVPLGLTRNYTAIVARLHDEEPEFETKDIAEVIDDKPVVTEIQLKHWQWIANYYMCPIGDVLKAAMPSGLKQDDSYRPKTETCVTLAPAFHNLHGMKTVQSILKGSKAQLRVFNTVIRLQEWDKVLCRDSQAPKEVTKEDVLNNATATTATLKKLVDSGYLKTYNRTIARNKDSASPCTENINKLNDNQEKAYHDILKQMESHRVTLLYGVTSSGKTEIYIHLIQKTIDEGKQVLYLLPEIALTVQITERLHRVFGNRLGIYHSKIVDAERVEMWQKQLSDSPYDIILGVRSSCFLPFHRLGLVIIDEEHETSFKQQEPAPRYHARSAAIMLAHYHGAKTLLGTATPSMETYFNAANGKYGLACLTKRYKDIQLPEIKVIDIQDRMKRKLMEGPFSPELIEAVRDALDNGNQAILFQNRRGYVPIVECDKCGWVPRCTNCDVSLTLHKRSGLLTCHYCGAVYKLPDNCPECGSKGIKGKGFGTEKIEDITATLFPDAHIARMDLDTTRTRSAYERIINDFSGEKTNILIGTQMVSKGLDFGKVSVVGILNADTMLNYPDFRAYEQAFTMMAQVSGRAGRKDRQGLVILQTRSPESPVIRQLSGNDFKSFYHSLLEERRLFRYPPFTHIIYIYIRHKKEMIAETAADSMATSLKNILGDRVLGPDKPSVARIKQMAIRKIMLKLENGINLDKVRDCLHKEESRIMQQQRFATVQVIFDVDPL